MVATQKIEEVKKAMGINYFEDIDLINEHVQKYQSLNEEDNKEIK